MKTWVIEYIGDSGFDFCIMKAEEQPVLIGDEIAICTGNDEFVIVVDIHIQ